MSADLIATCLGILERLRDAMAECTLVSIYASPTLPAMICIAADPANVPQGIGHEPIGET